MAWDDSDEARKVYKFMKCGVLEPEDLTRGEFRLMRNHYPRVHRFVQRYLEGRQEAIENGEWSIEDEPPDNDRRIKRYEQGNGLVKPWSGRETSPDEDGSANEDS